MKITNIARIEEQNQLVEREMLLANIMNRKVILAWWLVAINVAIWIGAKIYGLHLVDNVGLSSAYFNAEQLTLYTGMKVTSHVAEGNWWRIISSQYVHLDLLHIIFNAYGIYLLGPILERFYGARRLFVLYLSAGTIGGLASYYFSDIPSGGASGAVYGLVGAMFVFGYKYRKNLPERVSKAFTVGLLPWVVFGIGIGFLEGVPMDNAAHLGGLISGSIIAFIMASRLRPNPSPIGNYIIWIATIIGVGILGWTAFEWSNELMHCTTDYADYLGCYPELTEMFNRR